MNVHIALYRWKEGVSATELREIAQQVESLAQKVPGIIEIVFRANDSKYAEGYTHVILVRGENQAAIDAYRAHPDHIKVAARLDTIEAHGIGVDFSTS